MTGEPITVTGLRKIGEGVQRPEQVLVARDGRVYASDKASAIAEIRSDGGLRRIGHAGGEPNGIALDSKGRFLIANFGLGQLQRLDPETGDIEALLADRIEGRLLRWLNYVLVDSSGALWASVCTSIDDFDHTIAYGTADGFLVRVAPDGSDARVVADGVNFPNCMALDREERYLYVVRTTAADVVRFEIRGDSLGPEEPFSPPMGARAPEEFGETALGLTRDPEVARRWVFADGCAFDAAGNLWVTLVFTNRVVAVTPDRQVLPVVDDPGGDLIKCPTSIAWGGRDLQDVYIGSFATPYVVVGRSSVAGMPMIHQR